MKLPVSILVILGFGITSTFAQHIEGSKLGNGIFNSVANDSTWSMKMGLQLQFQGFTEWERENSSFSEATSGILVRRARLKFGGFIYSPKLTYKLTLGLANKDISGASVYTSSAPRYILDAVIQWNFYENFNLLFGQAKLPGNRELLTSSANLQFVDRSLLNSRYNVDRDLGLQLHHKTYFSDQVLLKESVAISQGEGRNITTGNLGGWMYNARIELFPLGDFKSNGAYSGGDLQREIHPKLALAAGYEYNQNAVKTKSNQGSYMFTSSGLYETDISTLYLDAMFKYQGFSLMTEYVNRTAEEALAKNEDASFTGEEVQDGTGFNIQMGYLFPSNWEFSGRYTHVDAKRAMPNKLPQNQYTLGVSKYIIGHKLKVQSDISYLENNVTNEGLMGRIQFQVSF